MYLWAWYKDTNGERIITDDIPNAPELKDPTIELLEEIKEKKKVVADFNTEHFYFEMLLRNFDDIRKSLQDFEDMQANNVFSHIPYTRNINRLFINALGSIMTYVEYYERASKKWEIDNMDRVTSEFYDNYELYRFLYKLRNFSVHVCYPITELISTTDNRLYQHFIDVDYLLSFSFQWGKDVKEDLQKGSKKINLKNLVDEAMIMYTKFHLKLTRPRINEILKIQKFYDNFAIKYKNHYQYPVLMIYNLEEKKCNIQVLFDQDVEQLEFALAILGIDAHTGQESSPHVN